MKNFTERKVRSGKLFPSLSQPKQIHYWLMRISAAVLLILTLSAQLLATVRSTGQSLDEQITLELKDETLPKAFEKIEAATGFVFIYSTDLIKRYPAAVSVVKGTRTVREILAIILSQTKLKFSQVRNKILIEETQEYPMSNSMLKVTGKITDGSTGEPLAGVNVVIRGSTNGTTTDGQGVYAIDVDPTDVLVFSFIGFKIKEEQVGTRTIIDLTLEEDIGSLDEVTVNAGYWNVKEREKTGNISRVSGEDIGQQAVSNPLQGMQARLPGVYVQQNTGVPGGSFKIMIRGQNSLRSDGNEPLYIVDGIPFPSTTVAPRNANEIIPAGSPLNFLNPNDIQSIEVLKDADATAIYGSRGSNGVVLITTKKAAAGKPKVQFNLSEGISKVPHRLKMLNTSQYLAMRHEGFRNDGIEERLTSEYKSAYPDLLAWDTTRYTDWQKELIGGTAHVTNAQTSITGGTKEFQYLVGGGYTRQTTVFPGTFSDQKISGHVNLNSNPSEGRFGLQFAANYLFDNNQLPEGDVTQYIAIPPNAPTLFNNNGTINWENSTFDNPAQFLQRPYHGKTHNLITNLTLKYRIANGLNILTNSGFSSIQSSTFSAQPIKTWDPGTGITKGYAYFSNTDLKTWNIEPQLEYKIKIGGGDLTALIGTTFLQTLRTGEEITGKNYTSDIFLESLQAAPIQFVSLETDSRYRYQAVFGRLNYSLKGKYIVNLTGRRDGSSRFGRNRQFANFGALGAAWIFTSEGLLSGSKLLSFGKIRSSYGTTGSDQIGDYGYLNTYSVSDVPYQGQTALVPTQLSNQNYSWESNKKFEIGIELGFIEDKIFLSASYYKNKSSNQLVGYTLPNITGFSSVQANFPATVQNSGLEFDISSTNIKSQSLKWTASFNITIPKNKLVQFSDIENSTYSTRYVVGKSLFIKQLYHYIGVDPQTGIFKFEDKDGNGNGTDYPGDLQPIKQISQEYYGGLTNRLTYKSIDLSFTLQFVKQTGYGYMTYFQAPGMMGNQPIQVLQRWRKPGDVTNFQPFTAYGASQAAQAYSTASYGADNSIVDASFIRLQNVYLSWQVPTIGTEKWDMKSKIFVQGQNLLTFTNYLGLDPETQSLQRLPSLRTISVGIQLIL